MDVDDFDTAQRVFEIAGQAQAESLRPALYELHETDMIAKGVEPPTYADTLDTLQAKGKELMMSESETRQAGGSKLWRATLMAHSSNPDEAVLGTTRLLSEVERDIEWKAKSNPTVPEQLTKELFELRGMRNTLYAELQTQITKQQKAQEHEEQTGRVTTAREAVAAAHNPYESAPKSSEEAIDEKSLSLELARYEKRLVSSPDKKTAQQFPNYLRNRLRLLSMQARRVSNEQAQDVRFPDTVVTVVGAGDLGVLVYSSFTGSTELDHAAYHEFLQQPFSVVAEKYGIDLQQEFPDYAQTFAIRENRRSS